MATLYSNTISLVNDIEVKTSVSMSQAWIGQTFTATGNNRVTGMDVYIRRTAGGSTNLTTVYLVGTDANNKPDMTNVLGTSTINDVPASQTWKSVTITSTTLTSGNRYAVVVQAITDDSYVYLKGNTSVFSGGGRYYSIDEGSTWTVFINEDYDWGFRITGPVPIKPTTPGPEDEEVDVFRTEGSLTWVDGGLTDTFSIYFGTTSGNLDELETEVVVGSPTWPAPMSVLEIKDYNPALASGYRSPIVGDILTHGDTTYTIWKIRRGDLVNVEYEAKLFVGRVGPIGLPGDVLVNDETPDVEDPQAVKVTLNDEWYFHGDVESAYYPYDRYYWRVDAVSANGTTTGDEWYFDIEPSYLNERPPDYAEGSQWQYTDGAYQWSDSIEVAGGGRYKEHLVVIGHNTVYYG